MLMVLAIVTHNTYLFAGKGRKHTTEIQMYTEKTVGLKSEIPRDLKQESCEGRTSYFY